MKYNEKYDRYVTNEGLVYRKNKDGILVLLDMTIDSFTIKSGIITKDIINVVGSSF